MVAVRIREAEACDPQPYLLWDTIWVQRLDATGGFGDWILAGDADPAEQAGGLRARHALHTATMIQLFTDARAPVELLPPNEDDRRGWWGDSFRFDDEPSGVTHGSLLWTLERGVLNDRTAQTAKIYAEEALAVLKTQEAVAETQVDASANVLAGRLELVVRHFDRDGRQVYASQFSVLWTQERSPAPMNFGDQGVFV